MSYVGMATNLVGGIMQSIAASQEQRDMFNTFLGQQKKQRGYSDSAYGAVLGTLPGMSAEQADKDLAAGAGQRTADYSKLLDRPLVAGAPAMSGADRAAVDLSGASRAKVGAFGDWKLNRMINDIRTQHELNKITNFAAGTASVFPYEMYKAQHSMDELAFWGQLISSIGGGQPWTGSGAPSGGAQPQQPQKLNFGVDSQQPTYNMPIAYGPQTTQQYGAQLLPVA